MPVTSGSPGEASKPLWVDPGDKTEALPIISAPRPSPDQSQLTPPPASPNRARRKRIRALTCHTRGWSRLRSPQKVLSCPVHCPSSGPGFLGWSAATARQGDASRGCPDPSFPSLLLSVAPCPSFLAYTFSSVAEGLTHVWHTGRGSVNTHWMMESGRCWRTDDQDTAVPLPHPHPLPGGGQMAQGRGGMRTWEGQAEKAGGQECMCPMPTSAGC